MKIPDVACKITAFCQILPSEDPNKVKHAISNIFSYSNIVESDSYLQATSSNIESLSRIQEIIHSRKTQRVYRRTLNRNLEGNVTWFYLNKQAAFSNTMALCENENESPLGPIKVIIEAKAIEHIITWLVDESA